MPQKVSNYWAGDNIILRTDLMQNAQKNCLLICMYDWSEAKGLSQWIVSAVLGYSNGRAVTNEIKKLGSIPGLDTVSFSWENVILHGAIANHCYSVEIIKSISV